MSHSLSPALPLPSVAAATRSFVARVLAEAPRRVEAKVASQHGMPLLCTVEAVLGETLSRLTAQELVWLNHTPRPGVHVLQLQAFGAANQLLAEARHEFEA